MQLCDDGHNEVCYESKNCPVCELEGKLKSEILKLQDKIESLEAGIDI